MFVWELKFVRKPRTVIFQQELDKAILEALYHLGGYTTKHLMDQVSEWNQKPKFDYKVSKKYWGYELSVSVDASYRMNQIFLWVDKGTGLDGPAASFYTIIPEDAFHNLVFDVPYHPKSYPMPGPLGYSESQTPRVIGTDLVTHPGIKRRNFSAFTFAQFSRPYVKWGFNQTIRGAIKRVTKKWGAPNPKATVNLRVE